MLVGQVNTWIIKEYCRIEGEVGGEEELILDAILQSGKAFLRAQTGLTDDEMDLYEDLTMALFMVCSDLYENRSYTTTNSKNIKVNPAADAIISQYRTNFL